MGEERSPRSSRGTSDWTSRKRANAWPSTSAFVSRVDGAFSAIQGVRARVGGINAEAAPVVTGEVCKAVVGSTMPALRRGQLADLRGDDALKPVEFCVRRKSCRAVSPYLR